MTDIQASLHVEFSTVDTLNMAGSYSDVLTLTYIDL